MRRETTEEERDEKREIKREETRENKIILNKEKEITKYRK